jgi:pteridine reductase
MSAKVALVTGGAKRVGRAIVERLFGAGYSVFFTYSSSAAQAAELANLLNAQRDDSAFAIRADFSQDAGIDGFLQFIRDREWSAVVNSASVYGPDEKLDTKLAMRVNYEAPCAIVRATAAALRKNRGRVVNMLDLLAERPWPTYSHYCASKAALWNTTMSLARELAPEATVNGIAPGVVEWPPGYPEEEQRKYLKRVPLARAGTPQDVADLVHFLVTEGSYITGQVIRLDGGRSIT